MSWPLGAQSLPQGHLITPLHGLKEGEHGRRPSEGGLLHAAFMQYADSTGLTVGTASLFSARLTNFTTGLCVGRSSRRTTAHGSRHVGRGLGDVPKMRGTALFFCRFSFCVVLWIEPWGILPLSYISYPFHKEFSLRQFPRLFSNLEISYLSLPSCPALS